jgi:dihydroorotate dehydrogenase (NAD+) catalytic subunit
METTLGAAIRRARVDLGVELGSLSLDNPIMPASGCFGPELAPLISLDRLGALVTKTVFSSVRSGNPAHRLTETTGGMLNAVGIPSPGTEGFLANTLPAYSRFEVPVIVSIGGLAIVDYAYVAEELSEARFAAFEVNVSCPNLEAGGLEIGSVPSQVEAVVSGIVARSSRPVIAKLTPNVSSVADLARAAEAAGASAVTVANTFVGTSIDWRTRRAVLGNGAGGLSGPAIKALSVQKVREVAQAIDVPIIGCGGICSAGDVLEYVLAGATAVQVGTATFTRPQTLVQILDELPRLLDELGVRSVRDLVGELMLEPAEAR